MTLKNSSNANPHSIDSSFIDSIDAFLEELTSKSIKGSDRQEFYKFLATRLQTITSADQVAIWLKGPNQTWVSAVSVGNRHKYAGDRCQLTKEQFDQIVNDASTVFIDQDRQSIFASAIGSDREQIKVLSLSCSSDEGPQWERVYRDLTEAIAAIATGFEQRLTVTSQQQKFGKLEAFVQLLNNASSTLELERVGFHLANDCRVFLNADRIWLFSIDGNTKLISCSSVSDVNPRSKSFRRLKRVVEEAAHYRQSYCFVRDESAVDPRLRKLHDYFQIEPLNGIYVMLLKNPETNRLIAALVADCYAEHDRHAMVNGLNNIVPCVESSLSNSLAYSRIPFRKPLQALRWLVDRFKISSLPKTLLALGFVSAVLASLFLVQTDFEIDVQGQLRPVIERHVFAPTDALVDDVFIDYGDEVENGQPIAKLVSYDYELEVNELQNKLSAAAKKLEANQILRTQASKDGKEPLYIGQLTAEIEQNRLEIEAINESVRWYTEKMESLNVVSPIAGQVISRDVRVSLLKRPVGRGSRLLTIADTSAAWHLVFDVPDRELGYMLTALESNEVDEWQVRYRLKSKLNETHQGTIINTDNNNSFDENGEAFVRAFVPLPRSQLDDLRVGQSVLGKIQCGRKSLFFVWTRDVRDFLRSNFFWF